MNTKIAEWYKSEFPIDDFKDRMDNNATFQNLLDAIKTGKDVYKVIFEGDFGDSLIRERCFSKLANIMGVKYGFIYDEWRLRS